MTTINPAVLTWARETAGLSIEQAAKSLGFNDGKELTAADKLRKLEAGETTPSRSIISRMSKQYRRPLLTFYLKAPPRKAERGEDFRMLPDVGEQNASLVDALVRDIKIRQGIIKELIDEDEATSDFVGRSSLDRKPQELAQAICERIDFRLFRYRASKDTSQAFSYLRQQVESSGVFVILVSDLGSHHSKVPVEDFRGFAIADPVAPFIAINSNDSKGALSFTLVHELAHIWLGHTGLSGGIAAHRVEKFCDEVASEFLLPEADLRNFQATDLGEFEAFKKDVYNFARDCKVSSTMVAYRLLLNGRIDATSFQQLRAAFREDFIRSKARSEDGTAKQSGPSYYTTSRYRAGSALVKLVDRSLSDGSITSVKASCALGVSPASLGGVLAVRPSRPSSAASA